MDNILGIDEAGRGPVLGPMVIAGVEVDEKAIFILKKEGIKDSKELLFSTIKEKYEIIRDVATHIYVEIIDAKQINKLMNKNTLNEIEFIFYTCIIQNSDAKKIYIDAFSSNHQLLSMRFKKLFPNKYFVIKHKADKEHVIVGAASIVAKYFREKEMDKIRERYRKKGYEDIGSGYPSDPRTISFLTEYYKTYKTFPEETRIKWETIANIISKEKQKKLF